MTSGLFWHRLRYPKWVHLTLFVGWCGTCGGDVREMDRGDRYMGYRYMCERCGHLHHNPPDTTVVDIGVARAKLEWVDRFHAELEADKQRKKVRKS